jgi:hypothetical protein
MIPSRTLCHALALWVNQTKRTMIVTRSRYNECDDGNLCFDLAPYQAANFLEGKISPPNRISQNYDDVRAREQSRMVITDGLIRNVKWHIHTKTSWGPQHWIKNGESTIPVRFKPVPMGFVSGEVDNDWMGQTVGEDWELYPAWSAATDWHLPNFDPRAQRFGLTTQTINHPNWEQMLAAAEHCWNHMSLSQVKVIRDYKEDYQPRRLADLWAHHRQCIRNKHDRFQGTLDAHITIDKIIASLGTARPNAINFKAVEKSLTRAVRRGRMAANRARNLLSLLAAGTGFQPKPRKALAN